MKIFGATLGIALLLSSCSSDQNSGSGSMPAKVIDFNTENIEEPKTVIDRFSYAMGYDFAYRLKPDSLEMNLDQFIAGYKDGRVESTRFMDHKGAISSVHDFQEYQRELSVKKYEENMKELESKGVNYDTEVPKFLEEYSKREGVITLPSGLMYRVLKEGTGKSPSPNDLITKHLSNSLIDGYKLQDTRDMGRPISGPLELLNVKGWKEALPMMKEGDHWEIILPPSLAFGDAGVPPMIPPKAALVTTIELISVDGKYDPNNPPAYMKSMPPGAAPKAAPGAMPPGLNLR